MGDEVPLESLKEQKEPTMDEETGQRLDFLFILKPKAPAPFDEVLIVEIKRGRKSNGRIHRVSEDEVNKFHSYVLGVHADYAQSSTSPLVSGLMIANDYNERAARTRRSLEQVREVKLEFQTWDSVMENTRRLHTGWLEVTKSAGSVSTEQADTPHQ